MLILLGLAAGQLFAQDAKLPNVQTANSTPPPVKVDGDLKEWNNTFQAYNKQTKLFYTISNDNQSLYLIVKSTDLPTSNKIVAGGISFVINTDGKKKDKDAFSLTYPVVTRAGGQGGGGGGRGGFGGGGAPGNRNAAPDSATVAAQHKQTIDAAKEIKVLGFKDIADSLVSVYNEYGLKAAIGYDAAGSYTYELAVPLKLLNITPGSAKDMAYHITVNGITANFTPRDGGGQGGGNGGGQGGGGAGGGGFGGGGNGGRGGQMGGGMGGPGGSDMFAPTDFWGMYSFAKK